jgi:hypothetical protein
MAASNSTAAIAVASPSATAAPAWGKHGVGEQGIEFGARSALQCLGGSADELLAVERRAQAHDP